MQPETLHSASTRRAATEFPPLELVNRPTVPTPQAAYYLNRAPQTLRDWKCNGKPDLPADFKPYALLRIAKNRQGQLGDVHLHYQGELTKFSAWGGEPPNLKLATAPAKGRSFKNEI